MTKKRKSSVLAKKTLDMISKLSTMISTLVMADAAAWDVKDGDVKKSVILGIDELINSLMEFKYSLQRRK